MHKNDELIGNVSAIGSNMEGIVRIDDTICFVPYALIGEKIKFKVLKVTKNVAFCKLLEVLTPAEERVRPRCRTYSKCGGCQLQHLRYKEQLKLKSNSVSECLRKIAGIDFLVPTAIKSEFEYEYRNKLQLPIRCTQNGNQIGFFAENSHRIVEISECPIQQAWSTDLIEVLNKFILASKVSCYNEFTGEGLLRHAVIRSVNGALIIVIVINGTALPNSQLLISLLSEKFKKFSLFINENLRKDNVILGDKNTLIFGESSYYIEEFGLRYPIVPESFIQVNDSVKRKLYQDVIKTVNADENTVVIDAYSGAGLMTALLCKTAKLAIGIEIVPEAVKAANDLAKNNSLSDKMINYAASCEDKLPEIIRDIRVKNGAVSVVLDPPRKGCDKRVLSAILDAMPDKIVYVSCSPQTLARDLGILTGTLCYEGNELKKSTNASGKYIISKIQPYDMFPQTKHVETLVSLELNRG